MFNKLLKKNKFFKKVVLLLSLFILIAQVSFAQNNPIPESGAANSDRIIYKDSLEDYKKDDETQLLGVPKITSSHKAPENAKTVTFILKKIELIGMTKFSQEDVITKYQDSFDTKVTLEILWQIMHDINQMYNENGYFLSRAFIPEQKIIDGKITINVIEGYIGSIELPSSIEKNWIVKQYSQTVLKEKPSKFDTVETFLLLMHDIPGLNFRSAFVPLDDKNEDDPAIKISIITTAEDNNTVITIDNFSSRYFGPQQTYISYSKSFYPLHKSTFFVMTTSNDFSLKYIEFKHSTILAPNVISGVSTNMVRGKPRYTLAQYELSNKINSFGINIAYQKIRKRDKNLSFVLNLDISNSSTDVLSNLFSRDYIRALRASVNFNNIDKFNGQNNAALMISRGINFVGASKYGDINISRAGATPNFTRVNLTLSRLQKMHDKLIFFSSMSSQISANTLYASELFGYGGQSFGKAYDSSEITGDEGVNCAVELRYEFSHKENTMHMQPYVFYDIGVVRNASKSNESKKSAASSGFGMRFNFKANQSGNIGVALPLTRKIGTPIYGGGSKSPRFFAQYTLSF